MNINKKLSKTFFATCLVMAFFVLIIPGAHAEVVEEWVAIYDENYTTASGMGIDSIGNIYVAGNTTDLNYLTVAYDSKGNQLWSAIYDSPGENSFFRAMATDNKGNVYVTGLNRKKNSTWKVRDDDIVTVAYDSHGNELWVARYDSPGWTSGDVYISDDRARAIAIDSAGNVYVTGESTGARDTLLRTSSVTVAYDSSGNELWVDRYYYSYWYESEATVIAIDSVDNIIVGGLNRLGGMLVAYDSSGNKIWENISLRFYPTAIAIDSENNVIVTGGIGGSSRKAYITVAYDSFGNELWVDRYDGTGVFGFASSLAIDSEDNVIVTGLKGRIFTTVAYDSSGNELWVGRYPDGTNPSSYSYPQLTIDSADNVYVTGSQSGGVSTVAYDSFGNELWSAFHEEWALTSIATDSEDNVYVAGALKGSGYYRRLSVIKYSERKENNSPLAEAGVNQAGECTIANGTTFTLDGSGSTDPDGDILLYTWSGPFGTQSGEVTTITLPLGIHTITLTVDDGKGGTALDTIEISVEDTTPPIVTKVTLSGNELLPGLYLSDVFIEIEATDTCSGVASVSYSLDGTQTIVSGNYASTTINSGGDHSVDYEASDNAGNVSEGGSLAFSLFEANASGLSDLIDYFLAEKLIDSRMGTSLHAQVTSGDYGAFINHVEAQSGKKITPVAAQALIEAAQSIMGN